MIFSSFLMLFCTVFAWTTRLKRVAAAGHDGSAAPRPYARIDRNYDTLDQVKAALQMSGLESSNLIIGVDFTKSNEWMGKRCFNGRSLHHVGVSPNPYEQAISIIGKTLSALDEDNEIPCFGFGDTSTHDQNVFNFYRDGRACNGLSDALQRYREIAPHVRLSGPTSLAPIIETATKIVEDSEYLYHILLIIADGQFVDFTEIMSREMSQAEKEDEFALQALMKIPAQHDAVISQKMSELAARAPRRTALPPPC